MRIAICQRLAYRTHADCDDFKNDLSTCLACLRLYRALLSGRSPITQAAAYCAAVRRVLT